MLSTPCARYVPGFHCLRASLLLSSGAHSRPWGRSVTLGRCTSLLRCDDAAVADTISCLPGNRRASRTVKLAIARTGLSRYLLRPPALRSRQLGPAARACNRPICNAIPVVLGRPCLTPNWPSCARDLGRGSPDRGPCSYVDV